MTRPDHETRVDDAQARKTTLVVAGVLTLIAAWNFYRGNFRTVGIFLGCAGALLFIGFLQPAWARRFHKLWMGLAAALGYVNSRILLSVMFYGILTPYGILSRLFRRDPLRRRGPKRDTYWVPRQQSRQSREQFERLF